MKNVLFATSALVAMAGTAYADSHAGIELTGSARLGLMYVEGRAGTDGSDQELIGTSRVRLGATASGTSDSGLTFGASARFDHDPDDLGGWAPTGGPDTAVYCDSGACNGGVSTSGSVFVSGNFGTLSYQDVDDAVENRVSHVDGVGLTGLGDFNEITRSAVVGSIIRYDYDAGAFGLSVSSNGGLETFQVGVGYSGDFGGTSINFGIGYDDAEEVVPGAGDHIAASLGFGFGDISVKTAYATNDLFDDMAVSVGYTTGALGLTAFYHQFSLDAGGDIDAIGLGASYDLGGGLSVVGGVVNVDTGIGDATTADFGLNMSF